MIYTLRGITERSKYIYYLVCCTFPDERIKYLEMSVLEYLEINNKSNKFKRKI